MLGNNAGRRLRAHSQCLPPTSLGEAESNPAYRLSSVPNLFAHLMRIRLETSAVSHFWYTRPLPAQAAGGPNSVKAYAPNMWQRPGRAIATIPKSENFLDFGTAGLLSCMRMLSRYRGGGPCE